MLDDEPHGRHGIRVEERTRAVAARLGLADFIYSARLVRKGGANREPGDGLLYANGRGAILQVKARSSRGVASDRSVADVQQWINKHGSKALRQGRGTRRELIRRASNGDPVAAVPVRAAHLPPDQIDEVVLRLDMDMSSWPTIVVFDHPAARWATSPGGGAFWITYEDWVTLNEAIRSVTGLLDYVSRCLTYQHDAAVPLGKESERFAHLVEADREHAALGGRQSIPYLDYSSLEDPVGAELYRDILERVWPETGEPPAVPIADYRMLMEHLDGVPPSAAASIGRWILKKRSELRDTGRWSSGAFLSGNRLIVCAYAPAERYADLREFDASLMLLASLRGHEATEAGRQDLATAGIGVLVADGWTDYRFVYARPPLGLPARDRRRAEGRWGVMNFDRGIAEPLRLGRNDRCSCGSDVKYKYCCGRSEP